MVVGERKGFIVTAKGEGGMGGGRGVFPDGIMVVMEVVRREKRAKKRRRRASEQHNFDR